METNGRGNQEEPHPQHHFVLVHGLCHGAWCWYKAATALRRAGHRVTAPDMAGCGAHPARVDEVRSFEEYSRPLLDAVAALPPGERAVLVGHSHGGCSVALAAERFPDKVAATVFVAASMPAVGRSMAAATTDEFLKFVGAEPDFFLDTKELHQENPSIPGRAVIFGPKFTAQRLYQLSPPEDLTLALSLIRPANRFNEDALMQDEKLLTEAGYGSARRVFVVVEDDLGIPAEFQRRMIAQSPGVEVEAMTAGGADHMAMLSRPQELVDLLRLAPPFRPASRSRPGPASARCAPLTAPALPTPAQRGLRGPGPRRTASSPPARGRARPRSGTPRRVAAACRQRRL